MPRPHARPRIELAHARDAAALDTFCREALGGTSGSPQAPAPRPELDPVLEPALAPVLDALPASLAEGCVLVARAGDRLLAAGALDLDAGRLHGPLVQHECRGEGLGRRLLVALERRAARFQLFRLRAEATPEAREFFHACGYESVGGTGSGAVERSFPRRQTRYGRRVAELARELGIPDDYGRRHRLPLQGEARRLADAGADIYDRPQRLTPRAAQAWRELRTAAAADGVELQLVSAYRSLDYQAGLLRRKRDQGQSLDDILAVSAAPGYSEHHTGLALDLTTPGSPVLETPFEDTAAFAWLQSHAGDHGFHLSYPRDNLHGLLYEPWHWRYTPHARR